VRGSGISDNESGFGDAASLLYGYIGRWTLALRDTTMSHREWEFVVFGCGIFSVDTGAKCVYRIRCYERGWDPYNNLATRNMNSSFIQRMTI
jgi:hypothetical protein